MTNCMVIVLAPRRLLPKIFPMVAEDNAFQSTP